MTPEDISKTAWEVWAKARKEVMCADQVAILAAALVAERERDRWLPVETAPDSPAVIWGWSAKDGRNLVYVGLHHGEKRFYDDDAFAHGNYIRVTGLTHWQPLPAPPSTDKAEKP